MLDDRESEQQKVEATLSGGAGAAATALGSSRHADVLAIDPPAANERRVVDLNGSEKISFGFTLEDVTVSIVDVDVILIFANGGRLILPSFVLSMISAEPPQLTFNGLLTNPQNIIVAAGEVQLVDQLPQLTLSENARTATSGQSANPAPDTPQSQPQVVQMTATQSYAHTPPPSGRTQETTERDPDNSAEGSFRLANRRADQSQGLEGGGASPESSKNIDGQTGNVIEQANAQPSITSNGGDASATLVIRENQQRVTTVTASDPDAGNALVYGITGGRDGAKFAINGTDGRLYFVAAPDFESSDSAQGDNTYEVEVQVSDGRASDKQILSITIENVNEAPVDAVLSGGTVTENAAAGTVLGRVTGTDPDSGDVLHYTFAPGGDGGGRFNLDSSTGELTLRRGDLIDFESSDRLLVIVHVTDQAGLSVDRPIVLTVLDANDAPVITSNGGGSSAGITISENTSIIATVTASDEDAGSAVTYAIIGGADASSFLIDTQTGVVSFRQTPDFEVAADANLDNVYLIVVRASDGRGGIDDQSLNVTVVDSNDPPFEIVLSNTIIAENAANGTVIGTATGSDPDDNAILRYSLSSGGNAAGRFAINAVTGELTVVDSSRLDFETSASHLVIIRVTDQGGLSFDRAFTVTLTDVNEAPIITANGGLDAATVGLGENIWAAVQMTARDPESAPLSYRIAGGADSSFFVIDASTGVLSFVAPPDFEVPLDNGGTNSYEVVIEVSDGTLVDTQAITVQVLNVGEPPIITSNGGGTLANVSILEGTSVITQVIATDPDAGSVLGYSIAGGLDAAIFAINAATGELGLIAIPDFENPFDSNADNTYEVIVQVSDGLLVDQQTILVTVNNLNEAPQITSDGAGSTAAVQVVEGTSFVTIITAVDPDAGANLFFTITGGLDAGRFNLNSVTGQLSFIAVPNFEAPIDSGANNTYEIMVQVLDGLGGFDTQFISVTVLNQNEAPAIISNGGAATASVSIIENTAFVTNVAANDPDAGALLTYSIVGGLDASLFTINAITGQLQFIGAPNFEVPLDIGPTDNIYEVTVQVSDGLGGIDTQAIRVTVLNQNEAPVITSDLGGPTATIFVQEGGSAVTTVVATDQDAGTTLTYTLIGGPDQNRFTINPTTGVLSFVAPPDFESPGDVGGNNVYDVTVQVSDGLGGTDTQAISVTVTNQNEAPVITSNGGLATAALSIFENSTSITTVTATDVDAGAALTYSIAGGLDAARFAINSTTGLLTFVAGADFEVPSDSDGNNIYHVTVQVSDGLGGTDTQAVAITVLNQNEAPVITSDLGGPTAAISRQEGGLAVTTVTASDQDAGTTLTYTLIGGADQNRFTINPTTGVLTFVAPPDFEAPADVGGDNTYNVTVQVSDGLGGIDTQALAITVTDANDAPVITSNGGAASASINRTENVTLVTTVTATDVDAGAVLSYAIVGGADQGLFTINAATGVLRFVAPPDYEAPADVGLNNIYDVRVQVSDQFGGSDTQDIAVTVLDVNEAPTITSDGGGSSANINRVENGTSVTTVVASDPDAGATLSFAIIGGADAARFTINAGTGELTFVSAPNFEAPVDVGTNNVYDVRVQVSDGLGGIDTQDIAVTVTNQNEAPIIVSNGGLATASITVAENAASVAVVSATDVDVPTTMTYSIVGGVDGGRFTIDSATGVLTFSTPPDFENPDDDDTNNSYVVIVRASDGALFDDQTITVTVTNQNEAPVITSNGGLTTVALNIFENSTAITTVTATDADAGATLTFSIAGGLDAARFAINSTTGVLTLVAAPDFEVPTDANTDNTYNVIVQVSDGLGGTDTQTIDVTVLNQNEAPVITSNLGGPTAAISLQEGASTVTTVTASDQDAGTTLNYTLVGGPDQNRFTINATTGVLTFTAPPDFEAPVDANGDNVYVVTVQVSDGLGGTDTQDISVTVTNQNEAPVITSDGGLATAAITVSENTTAVTTVVASDLDASTTLTYSLVGGTDQARFSINATTGALTFIAAPNFEAPTDTGADNIYNVVVRASDGVLFDDQTIDVTVINQNEAPSITSDGGAATAAVSVTENATAVTTVTATDVDVPTTLTYSIVGGVDQARFTINTSTGVLAFVSAPDFEAPVDDLGNNTYEVTVRVSDGTLFDDQVITVTVTNQNEAPVITSNGGLGTASISVVENGTAVTTVTATDVDVPTTLTFSLVGGADQSLFTIDAVTGVLTFASAPNFEAPTDVGADNIYDVIVRVSDGILSDDQTIAVTVTNQNEAPVITSNGGLGTASITVSEGGTTVTTATATDPDVPSTLTYSLTGGADQARFVINSSTGVLTFVAAPDFEAPTDVGLNNDYEVIIRVSDGVLFDQQIILVTVADVNDNTPVITSNGAGASAAISVVENTSVVTTVTASDGDNATTITYSLAGGADAARFTINATTGELTFIAAPNFEAPTDTGADNIYNVVVRASDGVLFDDQTIDVTVINQNEAPSITSDGGAATAAVSVTENATAVTTVTATDVDVPTTLTYSIVGGVDQARFTINTSTGVLAFVSAPDFETPVDDLGNNTYEVTVRVSDGTLFDDQVITVTVTDQNEAPVITSNGGLGTASISVVENGTAVTTVTATDVDVPTTLTFSLVGGADQSRFTIDAATGVLTFASAPNFEAPTDVGADNIYDVIVRVSDGILSDDQTIAVTVTNQNEAPVITSNGGLGTASITVSEGGTAVTTVMAADVDAMTTLAYSLVGGADQARFTIDSATGVLTFVAAPDFETPTDAGADNVYDVIVRASDGTLFDDQTISVTVTNQNEAPVITSHGGVAVHSRTVNENTTIVTTVTASDPDAATTLTYSISGGLDAGFFNVDSATGVLSLVAPLDFETPLDSNGNNIYQVTVRASDGVLFAEQTVQVTITDVNEAPVITSGGGGASAAVNVAENSTGVTTVTATDADAGAMITYAIQGGADAARFAINAMTGVLTFVSAPDFEAPADAGADNVYDVIVRVSDGVLFDEQAIAVTVTDEASSFTGTAGADTHGGTGENEVIAGLAGNDMLSGGAGNDTLTGGTDNDTIDGGSGTNTAVFSGSRVDYSITTSLGVTTVVDLRGPGFDGTDTITNIALFAFADGDIALADVNDINGTAGAEALTGGTEGNRINSNGGDDTITGGGGHDYVNVLGGNTFVVLDGGDDYVLVQGSGSHVFELGDGNNHLVSLGGSAQISSGIGDDLIEAAAGAGVQVVMSGGGNDTVNLGNGDDIIFGEDGNDSLQGNNGSDVLDGGLGDDSLVGGDGDDWLQGAQGFDTLIGGTGNDTLTSGGDAAVINGGAGNDVINIDASALLLPATDIDGGSDYDSVVISAGLALTTADLVASLTQVESIDFEAAGVSANLTGFTGSDAISILGTSASTGNVLTLNINGDDSFSAVSTVDHTANNLGGGIYQFVDISTAQEVARVNVI